jgi:hypothetical protein
MTGSRRVLKASVTAAAVVAATLSFAGTADAAGSCSGSLIDTYNVTGDYSPYTGQYVGQVRLYWDGTNNCAIFTKSGGPLYGVTTSMSIKLMASTSPERSDTDSGSFSQYAGPVTVAAAGKCIRWEGSIVYNGRTVAYDSIGWQHCG